MITVLYFCIFRNYYWSVKLYFCWHTIYYKYISALLLSFISGFIRDYCIILYFCRINVANNCIYVCPLYSIYCIYVLLLQCIHVILFDYFIVLLYFYYCCTLVLYFCMISVVYYCNCV